MAWTPPKKKISPEKALALAKSRATPLWIRSKALAWPEQEAPELPIQLRPLEPEYSKGMLGFAFFDPLAQAGPNSNYGLRFKSFFDRYSDLGIELICVVPASLSQQEFPADVKSWMQHEHWSPISAADPGALLARFFGLSTEGPGFALVRDGKVALAWKSQEESFFDFEIRLQAWLRVEDPGLPLIDPVG